MHARTLAASLLAALLTITPAATVVSISERQAIGSQEALWRSPLDTTLRVSRHFELPNGPYRAGHRGIDMVASIGAAVRAPASGTVSFAGWVVDRPVLSIRVDDHTVVSLEPVSSEMSAGDRVTRGQPVGVVDETMHCDAPCLHLGVRVNDEYVNPLRFLRPKPALLPW